jgi:hypothetical protein
VLDIKEHRLKVSENSEQKKIFGPTRDEVTRDWSRFHNEELHYLQAYSSSNSTEMIKSRKIRWMGHEACMGERKGTCTV